MVTGGHQTSAEGNHVSTSVVEREYHPVTERIVLPTVFRGANDIYLLQTILRVSLARKIREGCISCRGISDSVFLQYRVIDIVTPLLKKRLSLGNVATKEIGCRPDGDALCLALLVGLLVLIAHLPFRRVDVVFPAQPFNGFEEGHVLVLLEEREHVAALAAYEAFVALLGRGHEERGIPVIMERTDALVVDTSLLQCQELTDHVNDIRCIVNLINYLL